jgi:hypothetical protein
MEMSEDENSYHSNLRAAVCGFLIRGELMPSPSAAADVTVESSGGSSSSTVIVTDDGVTVERSDAADVMKRA